MRLRLGQPGFFKMLKVPENLMYQYLKNYEDSPDMYNEGEVYKLGESFKKIK